MQSLLRHARRLFCLAVVFALVATTVVRPGGDDQPSRDRRRTGVAPASVRARAAFVQTGGRAQHLGARHTERTSSLDVDDFPSIEDRRSERPAVDADTLLVHRENTPVAVVDAALRSAGARRTSSIEPLGVDVVSVEDRKAAERILERVPGISVEPNLMRYASGDPNDPGYSAQSHLFVSRFPIAWEVTKGSPALDIAIADTGVDLDHPDLDARIVPGYDFVNNDTSAMDDNGHGTMVAGIAAAETNNGIGVAGAAWNARIMPLKVLDAQGAGTDFEIAQAIVYAADRGAEVINLSLGGPGSSETLEDAVAYASSKNVVVVAAAGNESTDVPSYPAAVPSVVSVGATDFESNTTVFTNHGPWVDLVAPGQDMVSTALVPGAVEGYAAGDGTSFAAPVVAGAALLHKARTPTASAAQIAAKLASSAADRGPRGIDDFYGRGLLDGYGAIGGRTAASPPVPVGPDEPNDVPARATSVVGDVTGSISPEGDVDWFSVSVDEPATLTFTLMLPPATTSLAHDARIGAFGPDLEPLAVADDNPPGSDEVVTLDAQTPGTYSFEVSNVLPTKSSSYTVRATLGPATRFEPFESHATGGGGRTVRIADVTGDARDDVVVATGHTGNAAAPYELQVFPQRADGTLGPRVAHAMTDGTWFDTGDLDDDGDIDVATAVGAGIEMFTQTAGTLAGPTSLAAGIVGQVEIADVFTGGSPEIVVSQQSPSQITILERTTGTWTPAVTGLPNASNPSVGDVNGDGRPDIVGTDGTNVLVLTQALDRTFQADVHAGASGSWSFHDVTIGDVTGDGRSDIIAAAGGDRPDARLDVFEQGADGVLQAAVGVPAYDMPQSIEAADIDGDGRTDIVVVHGGWMRVGVFYQTPSGNLSDEELTPVPYASHYSAQALAVGDISGDAKPDVAIVDPGNGLTVLEQHELADASGVGWVRDATPPDAATGVSKTVRPTVSFARQIDGAQLGQALVSLRNVTTGGLVSAGVSLDTLQEEITITPAAALVGGHTYELTVANVLDLTGARLPEPFKSRFTVATVPTKPATEADVNGDGYDDVIVGVSTEDVGRLKDAGAFHILFGSSTGAKSSGSKVYTQNTTGVAGTAEAGDRFGQAIATGDVNGDGYDDVAIGAPGEDVGSLVDAGQVHVFLGSSSGLKTVGSQGWTQNTKGVPGTAEKSDRFGGVLVFGAFDGSVGEDLAVGVPGEGIGAAARAGSLYIFSGRSNGVTASGIAMWSQQSIDGIYSAGNAFGAALASGDFDGDTHDDLVVGAPGEDLFDVDQGSVTFFNGTIVGARPSGWIWSEVITGEPSPAGERFGAALASTDFGGLAPIDGYDDLAIGAPGDRSGAGRVDVAFSGWTGSGLRSTSLYQTGNGNQIEAGDGFGATLSAARVKAGVSGWLGVGAPGEDHGGVKDAGVVHVLQPHVGFTSTLLAPPLLCQNSAPVQDVAESGDRFGTSVRVLDVDKDGDPDVAVATPNESAGTKATAGTVHLLRRADQPASVVSQQIVQGVGGVPGSAEAGDRFGAALA